MSDEYKDEIIEGHDYDGIQELNNPLPKWWLFIFYASIAFSIPYFAYYEMFGGPTLSEQHETKMAKINAKRAEADKKFDAGKVDLAALLADSGALEQGKKVYGQYCAACHGANGEGVVGPNLADKYWIHSKGEAEGILTAIREGFQTKGMPPWKDIVSAEDQPKLTAYVISLQGTNPANAKEPQGELVE